METHVGPARVAEIEAALPQLVGRERAKALAELAWHLRERDTKRSHALACEVVTLTAGVADADAGSLRARAKVTHGECALLFRDIAGASEAAESALRAFESLNDAAGTADAHLLRARIARLGRDLEAAQSEARSARRAAGDAGDAVRQALAEAAAASFTPPRENDSRPSAQAMSGPTALALDYLEAQAHIRQGSVEPAIERLTRISMEARPLGMDELALESELAIARIHGALRDTDYALECVEPVLLQARERGWRGLLASATASACDWLLAAGHAPRAVELLREARASLCAVAPLAADAWLERLLGDAQLASGLASDAATLFSAAARSLAAQGAVADAAITLAHESRAHAAAGDDALAIERGREALAAARAAGSRGAEMEALAALGELHARTDARSAIAFLRHAAEVAAELDESARRAVLLRELARLHELCGDACAALAAERGAHAASDRAQRHRLRELALSARARSLAESLHLQHDHRVDVERVEAGHAADVRDAYDALEKLRENSHDVITAGDPPTLVACIERVVAQVADVHFVGLYVGDSAGRALARYAREGGRAIPVREVPAGDLESYAARAARERREMHVELESVRPGVGELRDFATLWFGPVICGDDVLGVLTLQSRVPRAYGEREKLAFRGLCGHAAIALENARLREALREQRELRIETEERMRRLASVDALTGLATRAHFFAMARERLERARRDGGPCGVIIADVDAFKAVNDVHGHAAGDRVLAALAATIARHLHGDDLAGRIGAEEFAVLLPGATLEATVAAAERMRIATESQVIPHDAAPLMVTMSFGCTAIADVDSAMGAKPAAETIERMVRDADAALYEAQGTGGNRAIAWPAYEALRDMRLGAALARDPQSFA